MSDDAQALAEASAAALWAEDQASQALGMELLRIGPGETELAMVVTARMTNGHGTAHGGFIFTLADSAFAFACNSRGGRVVGAQASMAYLRPAALGERLVATAREVALAGRSGVYDVRVSADGRTIAEFRGHARSTAGPVLAGER
jgi:acyl-CoA thioesterase